MKIATLTTAAAIATAIGFGVYMVDIDISETAELPDVDVSVQPGNMPEFDVETGDIEMGSEEISVTVPTLDLQSPEADNRMAGNQ